MDNFDIYLPLIALTPAIAYFIPPSLDAGSMALVASWIFVATLVGRPLGAFIFGSLADAVGRRRSTIIAVIGFGVGTLLIGILPGYEQWGMGAVTALIVLRFLDGVFLGGEYSGANVLAMEESPRERRGLSGGLIQTGATGAFVLLSLLTLGVFQIAPAGGTDSAYTQWGWRIPFLVGSLIAFAFVFYYRAQVEESEIWTKASSSKISALSLLRGDALRTFLQVFVLMTGMWLLLNSVTALIPPVLAARIQLSSTNTTIVLIVMYAFLTAVFIAGGALSQKIGRRRYLIATAVLAVVLGAPSFWLLIHVSAGSFATAAVLATVTAAFIAAPWAIVTPYLSERFRTANRAVGFGLGYSLAVILPAFYATYQQWLSALIPKENTVLVLVIIGAALVIIGAVWGPETKDVDFKAEHSEEEASRVPL